MLHHQQTVKHSAFITLTYQDQFLMKRGDVPMLVRSDLQKYFKRLRINEARLDRYPLVQYYACGEYGDLTSRPHYHFILFGDIDVFAYPFELRGDKMFALPGNPVFDAWQMGNVNIGYAEADSIRYVAQYVDKKLLGNAAYFTDRESPFQLSSQGLGVQWLLGNLEKVLYDGSLVFRGKKFPVPRFYREKIAETFPEAADGINDRVFMASVKADLELILELAPEYGGRSYDQLNHTERSILAARIYARSSDVSDALSAEIKFKQRMNKL